MRLSTKDQDAITKLYTEASNRKYPPPEGYDPDKYTARTGSWDEDLGFNHGDPYEDFPDPIYGKGGREHEAFNKKEYNETKRLKQIAAKYVSNDGRYFFDALMDGKISREDG